MGTGVLMVVVVTERNVLDCSYFLFQFLENIFIINSSLSLLQHSLLLMIKMCKNILFCGSTIIK